MPVHDFNPLYSRFPSMISQMPETFTSHKFILDLAHQHQDLYVEALFSYRHQDYEGRPAPFMNVHSMLARHLSEYPELIEKIRDDAPSTDVFGQANTCTEWRKVSS